MRPVDKGNCPINQNGHQIVFPHYSFAKGYLIDRLGHYCSYCERSIPASMAVEHIQPQSRQQELGKTWSNLLLACVNCNSTKKDTDVNSTNIGDYLWPDTDNTYRAMTYFSDGPIHPNPNLLGSIQQKAQNSIDLFGLNKTPANNSKATDDRWMGRIDAWGIAEESKADLIANDTPQMRRQIVRTALAQGHWSIWMTVFRDDSDLLSRFIEAFPGTCSSCFDPSNEYEPVKRPGGQC